MKSVSLRSDTTEITDAEATRTYDVDCPSFEDLVVSVNIDKGCTIVVTPFVRDSLGKDSATLTISDGGGEARGLYEKICAKAARVVVTKTEAGTTTVYECDIRGMK